MSTATALPVTGTEGRGAGSGRRGFAAMLRFGLHLHRWPLLGVAFVGFIAPYSSAASYLAAASTPALRESFGRQTTALGPQLAYLIPLPIRPDTVAGYMWWKGIAWLTLVFAAWGLAAAAGLVRNDEERGLTETWLASPLGRVGLLLSRSAAFAVAALAAVAVTALGTAAGLAAGKVPVAAPALLGQGAALLGITLACFGIGLAAAQLVATRMGAVVLGGVVLLALYVVDALARVNPGLDGVAVISPFHLADLTTAVVPGGRFDAGGTLALFAIAAVFVALAALGFRRRDLHAALLVRPATENPVLRLPSSNPLLGRPVLRTLWEQRWGLVGWTVGTMVGAGLVVSIARSTGKLLASVSGFQRFIRAAGTDSAATAVVSSVWLSIAALILAAYAIAQTSRWAGEDAGGRLEMQIAQPVARWRVVAERCATLAAGALLISVLGSLVAAAAAPSQGVHLAIGSLCVATALLVALALSFGALGALVISRLPRLAVPVLAVVAVAGFYIPLLAPLFKWPDWVLDVSLFHLYGTPLTTGVYWTGLWVMVAIVVIGFGGAMAAMRVREVGR